MDDFLPARSWAPPTDKSLPTPPQPSDQWKSPPYNNRNELSRDTSYTYKTSAFINSTSPIISPHQPHSSLESSPRRTSSTTSSSYFQYTPNKTASKPHHTTNTSRPSPSSYSSYTSSRVESDIEEVVRKCNTLSDNMTHRKSQFIDSHLSTSTYQDLESTRPWLDDMIGRANEVLNALLRLRKHQMATEQYRSVSNTNQQQQQHHHHINIKEQGPTTWSSGSSSPTVHSQCQKNNNTNITNTAIRQRKRGKRPAFQGRCHSCNISSTPEWRRGPDGARTLCNACGLHYAKLARKQQESRLMSSLRGYPPPPPIDAVILDRPPSTG